MFSNEYGEAAVEVLDILNNTNKEDVRKIPLGFIKFLEANASKEYIANLDHSKTIRELNIKEKTKEILGVIYINWWCNDAQREQYKKQVLEQIKREQEELKEKYNPDNIFEKRENKKEYNENLNQNSNMLSVIEYKENIFRRIINKILNFFKNR